MANNTPTRPARVQATAKRAPVGVSTLAASTFSARFELGTIRMDERPDDVKSDWSAQQLQFALDAAHIFVWDWNLVTGATCRCGNAAQMLGLRSGQAHDFFNLLHPDDHTSIQRRLLLREKASLMKSSAVS